MKSQDLNQEQKLQVILCGPLVKTERALRRRSDVEIIRENNNLNLLIGLSRGSIDLICLKEGKNRPQVFSLGLGR